MAGHANDRERQLSADLLAYHLGLADGQTRARVEAAFDDAESLASARRALQRLLEPLDADEAPPPPPNLAAKVLDRVEEAKSVLPMRRPAGRQLDHAGTAPFAQRPLTASLSSDQGRGPTSGPLLAGRELVGLAAAILIFVGIFVPGYRAARMASQQMACANNLRLIGGGYAAYAEANSSYLPYVSALPANAAWLPTARPGVPHVTNSQNVYRLVRRRYVLPQVFICQGRSGDSVFRTDSPEDYTDFPDPRNNSYSTDMVLRPLQKREFVGERPLVSDMTPLVDQNRRLLPHGSVSLNSNSHGRSRGQNVLRATLSVRFFKRPTVGVENDDIYRLVGVKRYTGLERPRLRSDAFLIP